MIPFYLFESLLFLLFGAVLIFRSRVLKNLLAFLTQRKLLFIPAVFEITFGLLTLHFRHETRLTLFVFLVGILLFIDGIFYLLLSEKLNSTIDWLLQLDEKNYRLYGLVMVLVALGVGLAAQFTV